jgi:hypothetical protein
VLRAREVEFPLRTLHRVPREGRLAGVSLFWGYRHNEGETYQYARDLAYVDGSPEGLVSLGLHILAQSVSLEDAPAIVLGLDDTEPGVTRRHCRSVRIFTPPGRRPLLRAPRYAREKVFLRDWPAQSVDRPQVGLVRPGPDELCTAPEDYERRSVFTVFGTRRGLRALAFVLFDVATDRSLAETDDFGLYGPDVTGDLGIPSCDLQLWSPYGDLTAYKGRPGETPRDRAGD